MTEKDNTKKDNSKTWEALEKLHEEFPEVWEAINRKRKPSSTKRRKKGGKHVPAKERPPVDE